MTGRMRSARPSALNVRISWPTHGDVAAAGLHNTTRALESSSALRSVTARLTLAFASDRSRKSGATRVGTAPKP